MPQRMVQSKSWREPCGTMTTDGGSPRDSAWIIIGASTHMIVGGKAADKERGPALPLMGEVAPESCADGTQQLSSGARAPEGQDLEPSEAGLVPTKGGQNRLRFCRSCCF